MQLSEDKTYRTRDGLRTGIRVRRGSGGTFQCDDTSPNQWRSDGTWGRSGRTHEWDLIEEQPATPQPFSYDACPVGEDGRKRAVTRDGREVVLFSNSIHGSQPLLGIIIVGELVQAATWNKDGSSFGPGVVSGNDLLIPPPPKRVVWCNRYLSEADADLASHTSSGVPPRLGNRAYPIEVE